jgi:uncharacterized protein (TIGR02246 family)
LDKAKIQNLYDQLIKSWNEQRADGMADLMSEDAHMIGFDGSEMHGPEDVRKTIAEIFRQYPTGIFVTITKDIKFLTDKVAMLRASTGIVPRGGDDINPNVNAHQTLVAVEENGQWKITLFQNTPAQFHMNPEKKEEMSSELRQQIKRLAH